MFCGELGHVIGNREFLPTHLPTLFWWISLDYTGSYWKSAQSNHYYVIEVTQQNGCCWYLLELGGLNFEPGGRRFESFRARH